MSDPKHIENVTRVLWDEGRQAWDEAAVQAFRVISTEHRGVILDAILDSGGAAAMLDALTRHGVLRERYAIRGDDGSIWLDAHGDDEEASPGGQEFHDRATPEEVVARPYEEVVRRLVTSWEVAPSTLDARSPASRESVER